MKITKTIKTTIMAAVLGLGLTAFTPAPAEASESKSAQKLVDALSGLGLNEVDYLYAYLQSVDLSDNEYNKIIGNTERVNDILKGTKDVRDLPNEGKVEVLRLFLESVELAHLQASIVDKDGNEIDLTNLASYKAGNGLIVELKDLKGNTLASINPSASDLDTKVLAKKINSLKKAVDAKQELEESGKFVPMPKAKLPNTATDNPEMIALGALLAALGAAALYPAIRLARKEQEAE